MVRNTFLPLTGIPNPRAEHKAASGVWLSLTVVLTCLVSAPAQAQIVEKVIDGDSLRVRGVGEVRLIGVDTPEWNEPFGKEARAFTRRLVEGRQVRLQYDQQRTDKYGRTLAYVHLPNGVFVNEMLIQHGYGRLIKRFPFRHRDRFQRYEREARHAGLGLWGVGRRPQQIPPPSVLGRYDDNGNGRITCAEARRHGIAPVHRSHPAYVYMHDANNDGIVCR